MIIKINYKVIAFICGILIVAGACWLLEPLAATSERKVGIAVSSLAGNATASSTGNKAAGGGENSEGIPVPIVMYHHMLIKSKLLGDYTITPTEFENDLKWIKEHGYTPVFVADLIAYVEKGTPLPPKPIIISFDDGYESTHTYAYPLLQKYQMKAVVAVIGTYSDLYSESGDENVNYSHLTWNQIREMDQSGLIEFQNHTYDMHDDKGGRKGARKKLGESDAEYRQFLIDDIGLLQEKLQSATGKKPTCFAYPFGYITKQSKPIIKELGFKCSFSCATGVSLITRDPESLYLMRRNNRPHNVETDSFFQKICKS